MNTRPRLRTSSPPTSSHRATQATRTLSTKPLLRVTKVRKQNQGSLKGSSTHYKSYRVDPQRLAELDLELINDITECYDHDETAIEHVELYKSSGIALLKFLFTPPTEQEGVRESTALDQLQAIDRAGIAAQDLVSFNAFWTDLKKQNLLVPQELRWSPSFMASRLEAAAKRMSPSFRIQLALEMSQTGASRKLTETKQAIVKLLTLDEQDQLEEDGARSGIALRTTGDPRRHRDARQLSATEEAARAERRERYRSGNAYRPHQPPQYRDAGQDGDRRLRDAGGWGSPKGLADSLQHHNC